MFVVRLAKIVMVAALAAFAFIVAYDNIADYGLNYDFARHVLSMDTTFPGNTLMDRAITDPRKWKAAYAAIIAAEGLNCLLLSIGAVMLLMRIRATADAFNRAKIWAVAGLTAGFCLWFFGFQVVAGEYLVMWQSRSWNGEEAAFRFTMMILGVLIFVSLPDSEMDKANRPC
jgi:predicted small integral membrane protein